MHNRLDSSRTAEQTFFEAIARKRLVAAEYNGERNLLAPHQLFSRHGALFISALNTSRNWRDTDERWLGQFKLAGLSNVILTSESFEPLTNFDSTPHRPGDELVFSL